MNHNYLTRLLLLTIVSSALAFSQFKAECTKPGERVNYVSSPPTRGTLNILWNCIFTIIACTWSVHYLNVPEQRDGRDPGHMGDLRWGLKRFTLKMKWMLVTIIAPEYILLKVLERRFTCKLVNQTLMLNAKKDCVPWSINHTHFAHMGGFVIRHSIPDSIPEPITYSYGVTIIPQANKGANISVANANVQTDTPSEDKTVMEQHNSSPLPNPFHLTLINLISLRIYGKLRLPNIQQEDLMDRSKSDVFTKVVAVFQISITVLDVTTRVIRKLPISPLEASVLAFAFCAFLIHVAAWDSPQDIESAVTQVKYQGPIPDEVLEFINLPNPNAPLVGSPLENHFMADPKGPAMLLGILGNLFFAAIHLLAGWNFDFPTSNEAIAWILTCLFCIGISVWWLVIFGFTCVRKWRSGEVSFSQPKGISLNLFQKILVYPSLVLYVLARLFLVGESFRALAFLPSGSFVTTWAANFPWFG